MRSQDMRGLLATGGTFRHPNSPETMGTPMSKNYSNPEVWQSFLKEHGLDCASKPPPSTIYTNFPSDLLVRCLTTYATARCPDCIRQRSASLEPYLRELEEQDDPSDPRE